jgi:hypothetical protein
MSRHRVIYCIATALHPRLRLLWFKDKWSRWPDWAKKAEASIESVYKEYLNAEVESEEFEVQPLRHKVPAQYSSSKPNATTMCVNKIYLTGSHASKRQKKSNQLKEYFNDLIEDLNKSEDYLDMMDDPWAWWLQVGKSKYPIVFRMACDFLSIPCTSCECERCFSSAKRTITDDRNSLSASTIEALQLQKDWLKKEVIESHLMSLASIIDRKREKEEAKMRISGAATHESGEDIHLSVET